MENSFQIYEGLLWEPPSGYFLLEYHMQRLERSARHFGFPLNRELVQERLSAYARTLPEIPRKVRLELAANGAITLTDENVKPSTPVRVALSAEAVDSRDEFLLHKTTRRAVFDRALAAHPEAQDVLLWNERREITETCHANVVLDLKGCKVTPPLSSGLQPGVFRAYLLDRGDIEEQVVPLDFLDQIKDMFLINSVRKWCEIRLIAAQT